jgi:hypothetical protein
VFSQHAGGLEAKATGSTSDHGGFPLEVRDIVFGKAHDMRSQ